MGVNWRIYIIYGSKIGNALDDVDESSDREIGDIVYINDGTSLNFIGEIIYKSVDGREEEITIPHIILEDISTEQKLSIIEYAKSINIHITLQDLKYHIFTRYS